MVYSKFYNLNSNFYEKCLFLYLPGQFAIIGYCPTPGTGTINVDLLFLESLNLSSVPKYFIAVF